MEVSAGAGSGALYVTNLESMATPYGYFRHQGTGLITFVYKKSIFELNLELLSKVPKNEAQSC